MGQGTRNIIMGLISAAWYVIWSIVIPLLLLQYLSNVNIGGETAGIGITHEEYVYFQYWIVSFGLISTAMTFFKSSAPKHSTRRAIAQVILIMVNCVYFYIYVVSGITTLTMDMDVEGNIIHFALDIGTMIYVNLGIYALNIIVAIYDLIISIVSPYHVKNEYTEKHYDKEQTLEKYGRFME